MLNQSIKLACQRSKFLIQDICDNLFIFVLYGKSFNKFSSSHVQNEKIICRGKKTDTSNKHVDVIRSNSLKVYSTIAVKTRKNHTSSGFYSA